MTVFIIAILLIGLLLIATESINRMNKAAVAMFVGIACWLLYIAWGTPYAIAQHGSEYADFLEANGISMSAGATKDFIALSIFPDYIEKAAGIVFYLLATMTIVEVLNNNGCFDFIREWLRTRNAKHYLWLLAVITFLLSANLDNLTTACLMLGIMHSMVARAHLRRIYGFIIIIAANLGGAFTVIGDVTSLTLWVGHTVTPTQYAATLTLPVLATLVTAVLLFQKSMPSRLELSGTIPPYRGDDTILNRWQRLLMLLVGIGGLWFIPTFSRITHLPPFVGAFCVLSLLWIVNELCNRSLMQSDQMVNRRMPMALQYANTQHILFYIGIVLAMGALVETGATSQITKWTIEVLHPTITGTIYALFSSVFGNVTGVITAMDLIGQNGIADNYSAWYAPGGAFWPFLSYMTAMGGMLITSGTIAGVYLARMEEISLRWYLAHCTWRVIIAWSVGIIVWMLTSMTLA